MKKEKIFIILILFMIISITNNYFAREIYSLYNNYYLKMLIWYIISFTSIYIISKINIEFFLTKSIYFYLLGVILLIITLFFGSSVNGSTSWLNFKIISFQPSEFMKISLILYLRQIYLKKELSNIKYVLITSIVVLIPSVLSFLQPDTGSVIIYLIIFLVFLIIRKLNKWYYIIFSIVSLFSITAFFILYFKYSNIFIELFGTSFFYRMDRITSFINNEGYQVKQSLTNISNAHLFGSKKIVYLPEAATDFAFSLFISKFGLVGLLILLILYYLFFSYLLKYQKDKSLLYPIVFIILFQFSINILMNIGLFPVIGITLPFISYGGSSLLSFFILLGILIKKNTSYR